MVTKFSIEENSSENNNICSSENKTNTKNTCRQNSNDKVLQTEKNVPTIIDLNKKNMAGLAPINNKNSNIPSTSSCSSSSITNSISSSSISSSNNNSSSSGNTAVCTTNSAVIAVVAPTARPTTATTTIATTCSPSAASSPLVHHQHQHQHHPQPSHVVQQHQLPTFSTSSSPTSVVVKSHVQIVKKSNTYVTASSTSPRQYTAGSQQLQPPPTQYIFQLGQGFEYRNYCPTHSQGPRPDHTVIFHVHRGTMATFHYAGNQDVFVGECKT